MSQESNYPYKRIRIFPDRDLRATYLEISVIDTEIFQRLRRIKQLGHSNIAYPTSEHSRFSHSLGVLYWTSKILNSLKENHYSRENQLLLTNAEDILKRYFYQRLGSAKVKIFLNINGLGLFDQLTRLYALVHDISHLPFGHTIEDQAGLLKRHDEDLSRIEFVFELLMGQINSDRENEYDSKYDITKEFLTVYLELIKSIFAFGIFTSTSNAEREDWGSIWMENYEIRKILVLAMDMISNTICADLMDYTMRDSLFSSMPKTFDKAIFSSIRVFEVEIIYNKPKYLKEKVYRFGINVIHKKIRHDLITAILDLLRIRYDLTEKVYYHHTKITADAMLEKALRMLGESDYHVDYETIYTKGVGDEGFYNIIEQHLHSDIDILYKDKIIEILDLLKKRKLFKAVFRITKSNNNSKSIQENIKICNSPEGRSKLEKSLVTEINKSYQLNVQHADIVISFPPVKMQSKVAKALIEWGDGQIYSFDSLPKEANYSNEVGLLTERYELLWNMSVYVAPHLVKYIPLIEIICEEFFGKNDINQKNYLRSKYGQLYKAESEINQIRNFTMKLYSEQMYSNSAKRISSVENPDEKMQVVLNSYYEAIKYIKSNENKSEKGN